MIEIKSQTYFNAITKLKKPLKYILLLCLALASAWLLFVWVTRPNYKNIETNNPKTSKVAYRRDYQEKILEDSINNHNFVVGRAESAVVIHHTFPFCTKRVKQENLHALIELLNDSSTFDWGEYGTPEYAKTIIFKDKEGFEIGYAKIQDYSRGEIDCYPYCALMKWGQLKPGKLQIIEKLLK